MRRLFSTLFVFVLFAASSAHAQTGTTGTTGTAGTAGTITNPSLEREFLKNFLRDQKSIWTSPYHVRKSDAKWLVPLVLGTATFIVTDRRSGDEVAQTPDLLHSGVAISYAGSGYTVGAAALTFYLTGRLAHNARARETGLLSAEALLDSALVGGVIKTITQRSRPDAGVTRGNFFAGGTSFPSGHALGVWSLASVVAHEYHDHLWVEISAYGVAVAVSAARVAAQRHYLSDVLVGSALGYAIGRYVYRTHRILDQTATTTTGGRAWPLISPEYNRAARAYGLTLSWIY